MILVAGGTGTLGSRVVTALAGRDAAVRILTRDAARAGHLARDVVDVCVGDVRDPEAVAVATSGVSAVVSCVQGFAGVDPVGPEAVDRDGNANLVRAAVAAGAARFVLVSAVGAAPDSPLKFRRIKHQSEQLVIASGLQWTVLRPTVYLETWIGFLGDMIAGKRALTLFGRGDNPINFVSADDVAALAVQAALAPGLAGATLEIGGPEDVTLNELAGALLAARAVDTPVRHVPLPVLRATATVLRPVKPSIAALAQFSVIMDTVDMTLAVDSARAAVPDLPVTYVRDLLAATGVRRGEGA